MKTNECAICGDDLGDSYGNNAEPVTEGICCDGCNWQVIEARLREMGEDSNVE